MSKPVMGRVASVIIFGLLFLVSRIVAGTDTLVLSEVHIVGTDQLTSEDVIRGLDLKIGKPTTRQRLLRTCERLRQLKLFRSSQCRYAIHGDSLSLTISVVEKWAGTVTRTSHVGLMH